jgi:hypothetical protein
MSMGTSARMPKPLRIAFMVFGLANIAGGTVTPLVTRTQWYLMPIGLLVGGVWAYVGYLGTIPSIRTVPALSITTELPRADVSADGIERGLAVLRRRRLLALWSPLAWLLPAIVFLVTGLEQAALVFSLAGAFVSFGFNWRWSLSQCPRCGKAYHAIPNTAGMLYWPTDRCRSCGLGSRGRW